jgi:DNA-binding CsgD family transcriptional regulator
MPALAVLASCEFPRRGIMNDGPEQQFKLTPAELDILEKVALGHSNATIARARDRSVGTVAKQVTQVLRKLGVTTRRELWALLRRDLFADVAPPRLRSSTSVSFLTQREYEVWQRVEAGHSNKLIAAELGVAESTIGVLVCRARAKLRHVTRTPSRVAASTEIASDR